MKILNYRKLGLAPQLTIWTVMILLTMVFVDRVGRVLVPMPDAIFMDDKWLATTIADVYSKLDGMSATQQESLIAHLPSRGFLDFYISATPDTALVEINPKKVDFLKAELEERLPRGAKLLITAASSPLEYDRSLTSLAVVVKELPLRMRNADSTGAGSVLITPDLRIHIALTDGRWLNVRESVDGSTALRLIRNIAAPAIGIVIILLISFRASHVLLTPLRQLSVAAEKLGRERSITIIPEMKIPEYKAIADSFNNMQTRLKRFVDERTQMLGAISHDLSTPLTRLRLLAEDLANIQQREQVLSDIYEMEMMIKTSLIFARDDAHQEPSVNVDIASLVISLCDSMIDMGKVASYSGPDHASVRCRPIAIRRALSNLLDNGCKYGDRVEVELTISPGTATIMISDHGPGIAEGDQERAFMPYQRLESSRNRETGGTGLGLTIARDIIHGHGGEISLRNNDAAGLAVIIDLPRPDRSF